MILSLLGIEDVMNHSFASKEDPRTHLRGSRGGEIQRPNVPRDSRRHLLPTRVRP